MAAEEVLDGAYPLDAAPLFAGDGWYRRRSRHGALAWLQVGGRAYAHPDFGPKAFAWRLKRLEQEEADVGVEMAQQLMAMPLYLPSRFIDGVRKAIYEHQQVQHTKSVVRTWRQWAKRIAGGGHV
jgi:hypothetical protein